MVQALWATLKMNFEKNEKWLRKAAICFGIGVEKGMKRAAVAAAAAGHAARTPAVTASFVSCHGTARKVSLQGAAGKHGETYSDNQHQPF